MDNITFIDKPIAKNQLKPLAEKRFGDLIKAVVDVNKKIMAIGAGMHADEEAFLLGRGCRQEDLWGINLYPDLNVPEMVEFDSMINIRPRQNNRSWRVEDQSLQKQILEIVNTLIQ